MKGQTTDIKQKIESLFPNYSWAQLENIANSVCDLSDKQKVSCDKIINGLKNGKLRYINGKIFPIVSEAKTIIIKEEVAEQIHEDLKMTEYKFKENIKYFLRELLDDPSNADSTFLLKSKGLTRGKLIQLLLRYNVLEREQRIIDADSDGEFTGPKMGVKYKVPKNGFDRKLEKLYINLFERNVPSRKMNEDGEGATSCASSGQYSQPMFSTTVRQKRPSLVDETTLSDVGDYQYDVPFIGDDESLKRKNGENGSVSVNFE